MLPAGQRLTSDAADYPMAVSPDGSRIAYVAEEEAGTQLYVRELSELEPKAIAGTSRRQASVLLAGWPLGWVLRRRRTAEGIGWRWGSTSDL